MIYRITNALLNEVSQWSQTHQYINDSIRERNKELNYQDQTKLLASQEASRLLRNYNYQKDTEELRAYEFGESIKEQRLLNRSTVKGVFVDKYI